MLESALPELAEPRKAPDHVTIRASDASAIEVETESTAPGLLVLSQVYYPAWQALVDGQAAQLWIAAPTLFGPSLCQPAAT